VGSKRERSRSDPSVAINNHLFRIIHIELRLSCTSGTWALQGHWACRALTLWLLALLEKSARSEFQAVRLTPRGTHWRSCAKKKEVTEIPRGYD
jgi:hypothetical protein